MFELKPYKLKDIAAVQTGPFGSQLHQSDYQLKGTPIITVEHLGENKIVHNNLPLVSDADKERLNKYTLKEGDIVFSRVGSVDRRAYVGPNEDGWMFSGRCLRVRINKTEADPKYLSYYFGQESFKEHIRMIAVGATMPSINTDILSNVEVSLPNISYQHAIAKTLSSLDDKIDLLIRQNNSLQELARCIFIGKLKDCNDFTKTILDNVITTRGGTTPSTTNPEFWNGEINWTSPRDLSRSANVFMVDTERKITELGLKKISSGLLPINTLLLSSRAPIGYLAINDIPVAINQGYIAIICDKGFSPYYMYLWVKENMEQITNASNGSTFDEISKTSFRSLTFQIPSKNVLTEIENQISLCFKKIRTNEKQINTLTLLRDNLLPKLMSGEASIKM